MSEAKGKDGAGGGRRPSAVPLLLALLGLAILCPACPPEDEPPRPEPEVDVNTVRTDDQSAARVACAADQTVVVVWTDWDDGPPDQSISSIRLRRFNGSGEPLDPTEIEVNTVFLNTQSNPAVAVNADGVIFVVWNDDSHLGDDDDGMAIRGRRLDLASGAPLDEDDFQVNTTAASDQLEPSIAARPDGSFVIAWRNRVETGDDTIGAIRYAGNGAPLDATDFVVNTISASIMSRPEVGVDGAGNFLIAWRSYEPTDDPSREGIWVRAFGPDGEPLQSNEYQANTNFTGYMGPTHAVGLGVAPDGTFLVAWEDESQLFPDASNHAIRGRRFAANGTPLDLTDFVVNAIFFDNQSEPTVAAAADGDFLVLFTDLGVSDVGHPGPDRSVSAVAARLILGYEHERDATEAGFTLPGQFQVNLAPDESQASPQVAACELGYYAAVYGTVDGPEPPDIRLRIFSAFPPDRPAEE